MRLFDLAQDLDLPAFKFRADPVMGLLQPARLLPGKGSCAHQAIIRIFTRIWYIPLMTLPTSASGQRRADIKAGLRVRIVQKQDQASGQLTEGIVQSILTNSPTHPHGIKVRLQSGLVGRVQEIIG